MFPSSASYAYHANVCPFYHQLQGSQYVHDHPCKLEGRISVRDFDFADCRPIVLSPKYEVFCCDQNGPPARRSEPDWRMEGAYLNRYVTDEQRSRPPIFIPP